jgi:hypothetical protein
MTPPSVLKSTVFAVQRKIAADDAILGEMLIENVATYFTLERLGVEIPPGLYRIVLSVSQRSLRGELWSPRPDHRLPEVLGVPGRTGIRVHALNDAGQSDGCIGIGKVHSAEQIGLSRAALTEFTTRLAMLGDTPKWIAIRAAQARPLDA